LACHQVEGPAADHVGEGLEGSSRLELHGRAEGIPSGQSEQRTEIAILQVVHVALNDAG
jgi:hypothetical protein